MHNYNLYYDYSKRLNDVEMRDILFIQISVLSVTTALFLFIFFKLFNFEPIKTVTIVRGLPGSGKSSWVEGCIRNYPSSVSINMDKYVTEYGDTMREAHIKTIQELIHKINEGKTSIFIEGIFSRNWEYDILEYISKSNNYHVKLIQLVGPENNAMYKRSNYIKSESMWDLRWCKFLNDNWEVDNRAVFVDLENSDESDDISPYSSYFNVEETERTNSRYNLRPRIKRRY